MEDKLYIKDNGLYLNQKKPNFSLRMGEYPYNVDFNFTVKKTLLNRLRYWLFCKFFPFRIVKWEKEE